LSPGSGVVRRGRAGSERCSESVEDGLETSEMRAVDAMGSGSAVVGPLAGAASGKRWLSEAAAGRGWLEDAGSTRRWLSDGLGGKG
jgi:hypothetical protein